MMTMMMMIMMMMMTMMMMIMMMMTMMMMMFFFSLWLNGIFRSHDMELCPRLLHGICSARVWGVCFVGPWFVSTLSCGRGSKTLLPFCLTPHPFILDNYHSWYDCTIHSACICSNYRDLTDHPKSRYFRFWNQYHGKITHTHIYIYQYNWFYIILYT